MSAARRGRGVVAIAVSVVVHIVVLTALALHAPTLFIPSEPRGPPEPIIPVLLMPKLPPPAAAPGVRPGPIRLHRRQLRFMPRELPVEPLPLPEKPAAPPAPRPAVLRPAPLPQGGAKEELRTVLRRSAVGCANPQAAGLTRAEREACEEQLGKGATGAAFQGLGLPKDKQASLDREAEHKDACRAYREAPGMTLPPGLRNGAC